MRRLVDKLAMMIMETQREIVPEFERNRANAGSFDDQSRQ